MIVVRNRSTQLLILWFVGGVVMAMLLLLGAR